MLERFIAFFVQWLSNIAQGACAPKILVHQIAAQADRRPRTLSNRKRCLGDMPQAPCGAQLAPGDSHSQ
jgi:hypothetical protein